MELIQFQSPKEVLQTPHHQQNKLKLTLQANLNLKKKETRHFWEHFNLPKPPTKNSDSFLVGSFNPFEKYARQTGSSPPKIRVYKN